MPWKISAFPELEHLDPQQRRHLLRRVPWWTYPLIVILSLIATFPIAAIGMLMLPGSNGMRAVIFFLAMVCGTGCLYQFQLRRIRRAMRYAVMQGFVNQRPPFCMACGYDLRASKATACPECGNATIAVTTA